MCNKKAVESVKCLMTNVRCILLSLVMSVLALTSFDLSAQRNDKLLNRPYADMRWMHLGFSVGAFTETTALTNNGFVTETGERWFVDQSAYSPGFCVNGLIDFRLGTYFNLRVSPGMYFGNRVLKFRDATSGTIEQQNIKSTYVVAPVDLKYSSLRNHNLRPYMTVGAMGAFDVGKHHSEQLKFNTANVFLTFGFGCDFYLPYFKFNPEIKFCFGIGDRLDHKRDDLAEEPEKMKYTQSLKKATSQMVVLTFYFE